MLKFFIQQQKHSQTKLCKTIASWRRAVRTSSDLKEWKDAIVLSSERQLSSYVHIPKSDKIFFHLFAQPYQNYVRTTSHVFGTHRRHT